MSSAVLLVIAHLLSFPQGICICLLPNTIARLSPQPGAMTGLTTILLFLLATGIALTAVSFGTNLILAKRGLLTQSPEALARNAGFLRIFLAMLGLIAIVFSIQALVVTHAFLATFLRPVYLLVSALSVFLLVTKAAVGRRPSFFPAQRVRAQWATMIFATVIVLLYALAELHNLGWPHL